MVEKKLSIADKDLQISELQTKLSTIEKQYQDLREELLKERESKKYRMQSKQSQFQNVVFQLLQKTKSQKRELPPDANQKSMEGEISTTKLMTGDQLSSSSSSRSDDEDDRSHQDATLSTKPAEGHRTIGWL